MTNLSHGLHAEQVAVDFVETQGYRIVDRNWRTKWCEIDIVIQKNHEITFVEVKYRQNDYQGDGLDYVTVQKLARMARAAEAWVQAHRWPGDYSLGAIEVAGNNYQVQEFIEDIEI